MLEEPNRDAAMPTTAEEPHRDAATLATAEEPNRDAEVRFVLQLARALHIYGTPAHRLERAMSTVASQLGLEAEFFSTPTSIMVGFGGLTNQRVHLLRVEPGAPNLGHLAALGAITTDVVEGRCTPIEGLSRMQSLLSAPPRWPTWLQLVAFVLSSAAVASFIKVRTGDLFIASLLGLVTGAIAMFTQRRQRFAHVTEPVAAFMVTTIAFAFDVMTGRSSGYLTSLAGLVVLLPGLTFTVALTELSTRHLASGTARLAGAMVVFLSLGFGLALGAQFGTYAGRELLEATGHISGPWMSSAHLPAGIEWLGVLIAALSFTVLLNAQRRDVHWILIVSVLAYAASRYTGQSMGEELASFVSAALVTAVSTFIARSRKRSSIVTSVPGLLILVPGSIGFRSMTSLVGDQVEAGIATAFHVAIIGISLAAGIVAGNVISGKGESREF